MTFSSDASALLEAMRAGLEQEMQSCLAAIPGRAQPVAEMIAYHLGWDGADASPRGKRLRPLLCLASCAAAGGEWRRALPAASAIELIHNFSLIHDDIEDRSATRRGRPTLWVRWGLAQALNTGDALLILARSAALRLRALGHPAEQVLWVIERIDRACLDLTFGQHRDLALEAASSVSEAEYLEMIGGKTAALLEAAAEIGARLGGAAAAACADYAAFGHHLGLAFQLQDDILGIWGDPEQTGKPAGDDLRDRKKSFPAVYALAHSPDFASRWSTDGTDSADVEELQRLVDASGARALTVDLSRQHVERAQQALRAAGAAGPGAEALARMAELLPDRRA
jgi:geranylgeranyl diphosphate synthase type I